MSTYIIHTETYEHKCGKKYIVEVEPDYDFGPPEDNSDCHGRVVELDFDPEDEGAVDDYIEANTEEDSPEELEERARMASMRLLGKYSYRYAGQRKYYDVWESLKIAKKKWGHTTDEAAREAVEKDYAYIDGWYSDDWSWCSVTVYATDEDGEKDEDHNYCIGGYETTIIEAENRSWFDEVIEDCVHSIEHELRRELHEDQLELAL